MVNFSALSQRGLLGRLVRQPLRLLPPSLKVRILQGPARGMKWTVGSHTHGCWLGSYEMDKQLLLASLVDPGQVVYDLGANVGFYALVLAKLVGPAGQVVAFEPLPRNVSILKNHVRINRLYNVRVVEKAVSDTEGRLRFAPEPTGSMGYLDSAGDILVETVTLDRLNGIRSPDFLKIDVEGAEAAVLRGAEKMLQVVRPVILIAIHNESAREECGSILARHHYTVQHINGDRDEWLATPT